jgi:DNA mismatch repair protein MLH1
VILLKENAEMINEYFSIHIDKDVNLIRFPVVLDQYTPDMDHLPEFVFPMGNDVSSLLPSVNFSVVC